MVHFNWTQLIPSVGHDWQGAIPIATACVAGGVLFLIALIGRKALGTGDSSVELSDKLSVKGFFEAYMDFIGNLADLVIGHGGRKFIPMFASIFLLIWINNLLGLVPGMTPATDNINTTVAAGLFVFIAYNIHGFKEHGISYLKQFMGPLLILSPLMIVIELVSHFVRPVSLGLRLQGNMLGDHTVLGIFLDLVPFLIPVIFYFIGLFVCTMQAFVFTMLSMIYVSMAISHDH